MSSKNAQESWSYTDITVWRWELGETVIPKAVELALRYIAEKANKE